MISPGTYKDELITLMKIAWPIAATSMLQYCTLFVSLIFCGQISKDTLDGAALASTVVNVTGNAVMLGLSSACDTLFSQTFGSINKKRVGIIVQKSLLILLLGCIPVWAIYLNTGHLLRALGQDEEVARLGGKYATIYIAGLPGIAVSDVLAKFLQSQSIVLPSMLINVVVNILNAAFHAMFMFGIPLGIEGAAIAVSLTQWSVVILHIPYICYSGVYKATWGGLSLECLLEWGEFFSLAFPGMIMFCLEWWSFEIITFIAGFLGVTPLAAHTINFTVASLIHMIPLGIGIGSAVRVGFNLGERNFNQAKIASRVSLFVSVTFGVLTAVIILALKSVIPKLFSNDSYVTSYASSLLLLLSLFVFLDYSKCITGGIIRGIGHQRYGAYINLIGYYIIALPIGIPIMLLTDLEIYGAWWAMCISAAFQSITFVIRIAMCNWEHESEKAQVRAGIKTNEEQSHYKSIDSSTNEKMENNITEGGDSKPVLHTENEWSHQTFKFVIVKRLIILFIFVIILVCGISLRIYLDSHSNTLKLNEKVFKNVSKFHI